MAAGVNSLLCYTCNGPTASSECTTLTNCTAEAARYIWCKTIVYSGESGFPFQGNESVVRMCADICKESFSEDIGVSNPVF
ncbi:ly6/PLAUR domain-containing protein 2-like isoform X2 [Ambystoma mexicanum]|uniref:ly6/PLAUR domain-containing protein 2-like isoform X2 n=1 Tax=Ambystoma mexicanum TaxID=8296 RepID=UPI0037E950E8